MAFTKNTLILVLLCFILIQELEIYSGNQHMVAAQIGVDEVLHCFGGICSGRTGPCPDFCKGRGYPRDCNGKCGYRCSKASRQKICMRACTSCCRVCNCVPPGTFGNRDVCPCYASLTTHEGKLKCP